MVEGHKRTNERTRVRPPPIRPEQVLPLTNQYQLHRVDPLVDPSTPQHHPHFRPLSPRLPKGLLRPLKHRCTEEEVLFLCILIPFYFFLFVLFVSFVVQRLPTTTRTIPLLTDREGEWSATSSERLLLEHRKRESFRAICGEKRWHDVALVPVEDRFADSTKPMFLTDS